MSLFTLATLADASAGPKPARLAVIGHPVGHSLSPQMHQPALDEAGIDARYVALEVEPGEVARAFTRMRELGFIGCNVTVPHKFEALEACDEIDDTARSFGAVNTVRFDADATRGTNTDGQGFEQAVKEALGLDLPGAAVAIFGAGGGAGGAIAAHCARRQVGRLVLVNRTLSKIETLAGPLRERHPDLDLHLVAADAIDEPGNLELVRSAALLVNTSSLGLKDDDPSPIPVGCLTSRHAVFDTIYHPTALLKAAGDIGAVHANGSLMLLHQGVAAFRYWFPDRDPEAAMRRGLLG
ncbi:shikimate dehydrogenase family protein [Haloferula sp. A504]|uniref:shikimate dehydrogenase family protein n=1 Tax=Haloferula sp. A504 TaxID=3373601 RepID=UPI0031C67666|nr:shikimate dehydrogenase [Verrucomicrobiaceae bacterium E54]